jgi:hypothetical protein
MFADDTQLFNKNDESVKKSFDILTIYEKPLVQKSIMKRQKVCILDRLKITDPSFTKIVWTKDNAL